MITPFQILLVMLFLAAIFGWPAGFAKILPEPVWTIVFIVVLLVLIILGVVRF